MTAAPFEAVLFDLDGTLIDSIRLILDSFHHTLRAHGKPPQSDAELLVHVGTPLATHLAHYSGRGGAASAAEVQTMVATYRAWNHAQHDQSVRAFEGAVSTPSRRSVSPSPWSRASSARPPCGGSRSRASAGSQVRWRPSSSSSAQTTC